MISNPYTYKTLDVSLTHITEKDNDQLNYLQMRGYAISGTDYGYIFYIETEKSWDNFFSPQFLEIVCIAIDLECEYIRFDEDGKHYPELKEYDW